jgi:hypothetical protein
LVKTTESVGSGLGGLGEHADTEFESNAEEWLTKEQGRIENKENKKNKRTRREKGKRKRAKGKSTSIRRCCF